MTELPIIERHRLETRRRRLTVAAVERLSPAMLRLVLKGGDLEGFTSLSPDDHIKVFVPDGTGGTAMRDYTPRRHDAAAGRLWLDFALHDAGPATLWALSVKPGDTAEIGGPRGSAVIGGQIRHWVLVGDETALPAIARRIEELPAGARVTCLVAVPSAADEQVFDTEADHRAIWVHRDSATDPVPVLAQLAEVDMIPGTFVWIAAEAGVARALRDHFLDRGHPKAWMKASGYWMAGKADASEKDM
jgi:NADPH-dependent ferric siderophore reductase